MPSGEGRRLEIFGWLRGQVVLGARTRMETQDLPRLFRSLELLDLGPDDLARLYREHLTKKKESEL